MAKITIYYCGLISHIGDDKNKRKVKSIAAVIKDDEHEPIIAVNGLPFLLMSNIGFSDVTLGDVSAGADFLKDVPSLLTVFGEDVSPTKLVLNSFVMPYPAGGKLEVEDRYLCEAIHKRNSVTERTGCVARITRLTATVPDTAKIVFTTTVGVKSIALPDGANVLVANWSVMKGSPQSCGSGNPHGHVQKFNKILKNTVTVTVEETGGTCDSSESAAPSWIAELLAKAPLFLEPQDEDGDHDHEDHDHDKPSDTKETRTEHSADKQLRKRRLVTFTSSHVECGNTDWP